MTSPIKVPVPIDPLVPVSGPPIPPNSPAPRPVDVALIYGMLDVVVGADDVVVPDEDVAGGARRAAGFNSE